MADKDMSRTERNKKNKQNPRGKSWVKRIFFTLFLVVMLAVVSGCSLFVYYASGAPDMTEEDLLGTFSSELVDKDGEVFYTLGAETREFASPDEFPQVMVDSMLAIEDQSFESHFGVDPVGIGRAAWGFVSNRGQIVGGGSTITQQLVKLSVFSTAQEDQTLERKAQEAWLAVQLERELSKEQILSMYMNKIHMAGNVYGISTAAEEYYDKDVSELELHEAALFAGMAQAPNRHNPYVNPESAENRRNVVLNTMYNNGDITAEEAEAAQAVPIQEGLVEQNEEEDNNMVFDGYLTAVLEEVAEKTDFDPYTAGLTIETNLDMEAQEQLYDIINSDDYVDFPNDEIQTAASLVDVETGQVRALGGGRNQESQLSTNRATNLDRNIGSTIKPLTTYAPAIEYEQFSTYHQEVDEEYTMPGGSAPLRNYDNQYVGQMSLREALVDSRNVPTAKIFNEELEQSDIEEFLTNVGIDPSDLNDAETDQLVAQNAINGRMTPLQLAGSYAAFANEGSYTDPYTVSSVITQEGQEIDLVPETNEAMADYTAYMITDVLQDVAEANDNTVGISGVPQAGKTGTTNYTQQDHEEYNIPSNGVPDSWYVGYTSNYSLSVWAGYDSQFEEGNWLSFEDGTRQLPRHIYRELMSSVSQEVANNDWSQPSSVTEVDIEDGTNPPGLPGPNTPSGSIVSELFVSGTEPTEVSVDYGEELSAPSGLAAQYDEESDELSVTWDEYELEDEDESASYQLSIDGESTTVNGTDYSMTNPPTGNIEITLAIQASGNTGPSTAISIEILEQDDDENGDDEDIEDEEDDEEESVEEEPDEPDDNDDEDGENDNDVPPDPPIEEDEPDEPDNEEDNGDDSPPDDDNEDGDDDEDNIETQSEQDDDAA